MDDVLPVALPPFYHRGAMDYRPGRPIQRGGVPPMRCCRNARKIHAPRSRQVHAHSESVTILMSGIDKSPLRVKMTPARARRRQPTPSRAQNGGDEFARVSSRDSKCMVLGQMWGTLRSAHIFSRAHLSEVCPHPSHQFPFANSMTCISRAPRHDVSASISTAVGVGSLGCTRITLQA